MTAHKDPKLAPPLPVSDGDEWADHLAGMSPANAKILLAVVHTLYPHQSVAETVYRRVILRFARLAASDLKAAAIFDRFCAQVTAAWPVAFTDLAETYRVTVLKSLQSSNEFMFIQRLSVKFLYDDIEVWAAFGYEGASVHLGGYIKRGFNDLAWLPPLPNEL